MSASIIRMPPRTEKQAVIAQLEDVIEKIKRDEIYSFAYCLTRVAEIEPADAADPGVSLYSWRRTFALIGASVYLTQFLTSENTD